MQYNILLSIMLTCCPLAAVGAVKTIDYAGPDSYAWGTQRTEVYDIAVFLRDPLLTGSRITAIKVSGVAVDGTSGRSVWMSSELKLQGGANIVDIGTFEPVETSVSGERVDLTVTLDEPYVLTDKGVYIGFSLKVDKLTETSRQPFYVGDSENPDAFMIHTGRTYMKWGNYNLGIAADIAVSLEGDFSEDALMVLPVEDCGALEGEDFHAEVLFRNIGESAVRSLAYTYTVGGIEQGGSIVFEQPKGPEFDKVYSFDLTIPYHGSPGSYPWQISIDKVNDKSNGAATNSACGMLYVYPYLPERRPLMEEYTGTACGWCPRGTVGMEFLAAENPERFIGIAYHSGDIMQIDCPVPDGYPGSPTAFIDRSLWADPYQGLFVEEFLFASPREGILPVWEEMCQRVTTADLTVSAEWHDEGKTSIDCEAEAVFVRDYENADFRLSYILVADGLKGSDRAWRQSNYFSGMTEYENTAMAPWVKKPSKVEGLEYNDVVVLNDNYEGIEASVPSTVEMCNAYRHKGQLNLAQAPLVQDKSRLKVVAVLLDSRTGTVVNAAKTTVGDKSAVVDIKCPVKYMYYTIEGLPTTAEAPGIYVRVAVDADGSRAASLIRK